MGAENSDDFATILKTQIKTLKKQIDTSSLSKWFGSERRGAAGNLSGGGSALPPKPNENELMRVAALQAASKSGSGKYFVL